MPTPRLLIPTVLMAIVVVWTTTARETPAPPSVPLAARPSTQPMAIGKAGCSATGCHGRSEIADGPIPLDCWKESYTRWLDRDPHSQAYAVLRNDHSQTIMRNLYALSTTAELKPDQQAFHDSRCLACHTNPTLAVRKVDDGLDRLRAEGVSCEACHGNAEPWQLSHTTWTTADVRKTEIQKSGMIDLNPVVERATACAGCHIGAKASGDVPLRDMNHDMIAAGHPRLEFDYAQYLQALPKHWHEKDRTTANGQVSKVRPLMDWYAGQMAVERATAELTLNRLERQSGPELADWKCSSCHQSLNENSGKKSNRTHKLGFPSYNAASLSNRSAGLSAITFPGDAKEIRTWSEKPIEPATPANVRTKIGDWLTLLAKNSPALETADADDTRRLLASLHSLNAACGGSADPKLPAKELVKLLQSQFVARSAKPE